MNTIDVIKLLVSQMTPTFNILNNTEVSAGCWKLENCKTFWLTEKNDIVIDGETYVIDSVDFNKSITIKGTNQPSVESFKLVSPYFDYGTHRIVNTNRGAIVVKQEIQPVVYLMELMREVEDTDEESTLDRTSNIRIFFLDNHHAEGDITRKIIQTKVIQPMHEMADKFRDLILEQEGNFNNPKSWDRYTWALFGVPEVWGNKKCVFDEPLSGVELRFSLPILENLGCDEYCSC